jgi:Protein of unknown function (DUF3995)
MRAEIAALLALLLGAVALLHAYSAMGGLWPGRSEADLIASVIGDKRRRRMPHATLTWLVALLIGIAAVWPLLLRMRSASPLPGSLVSGIGAALALVFLARGGAGYLPAWRRAHSLDPFARLDRSLYSPLCLLVGAGFLYLVFRSLA